MRVLGYRPFKGSIWWDRTVLELIVGGLVVVVCGVALFALATQL